MSPMGLVGTQYYLSTIAKGRAECNETYRQYDDSRRRYLNPTIQLLQSYPRTNNYARCQCFTDRKASIGIVER